MRIEDMLRQALALAGISQAALARETGLTTKHINQVFQGKAPLSADVAVRIERVLPNLSAEELMVAQARAQVRKARWDAAWQHTMDSIEEELSRGPSGEA